MNRCQIRSLVFAALFAASIPVSAASDWGLSAGLFDVTRSHEAGEVGIERYFREFTRFRLRPQVGIAVTADESYYGFAGARRVFVFSRWSFEPSFSVSLYERGDGKELGGPLEFRSGFDLLYECRNSWKVGVGYYHLSNARVYDVNPGANSLQIRVLFPGRRDSGGRSNER